MKKNIVIASLLGLISAPAFAIELDTDNKRFSYLIGMQVGQQITHDKVELDEGAFLAAIQDAQAGKPPQLSQEEIQATLLRIQEARSAEIEKASVETKRIGQEFLMANKAKEGVVELPSGLQYKVIIEGTGVKPKATDMVEVHYRGTLIDGTEFDSSYSRGTPASFPVNGVIKGWQEALQLMAEGSKWQLVVPSDLAYGERSAGAQIGPHSTLLFDVELLKIK